MQEAELRFLLLSRVDGREQPPLAADVRLARDAGSQILTLALSCDSGEAVGSLVWLAAMPRELESRTPPYEFEEKEESLRIRLVETERHQVLTPTWVAGVGCEEWTGILFFVQARSGFLELERTAEGWRGRIELEGESMIFAKPGSYRAELVPLTDEAAVAAPDAPVALPALDLPPEMRLASDGDERYFARDFAAAAALYEASLELYRGREAESERSLLKASDLISRRNLLVKLTSCHFRRGDFPGILHCLFESVAIDSRLRVVPTLQFEELGPYRFGSVLETWRQRLGEDRQRIESLEQSQGFLEVLLLYFLDRGEHDFALEVSERARARAFADLLSVRRGRPVPPETLTAGEIREQVQKHRCGPVVEYFVAGELLAIFTIAADGKIVYREAKVSRAELEAAIAELRPLFEGDVLVDDGSYRMLLRRLYGWLLQPIEDLLPGSPEVPVTIVAHGQLHRLPFSALLFGPGREDWVVHRHALTYLPSLAVLEQLAERRKERLAVCRPVASERVLAAFIDPRPLPPGFGSVPWLAPLGAGIRGLAASGQYREFLHEEASESRFRSEAGSASVLVVASHAFAERSTEPATAIVLGADGEHDGYLEPAEIESLRLSAEVVMLTACQTGRGVLKADGVQGLARSFFAAGAEALVATLWEVPAAFATEQSLRFLEIWLSGEQSQATALRSAQAAMARNHRRQPRIWAGPIRVG